MIRLVTFVFILFHLFFSHLSFAQNPDLNTKWVAVEESLMRIRETQKLIERRQAEIKEELATLRVMINRN